MNKLTDTELKSIIKQSETLVLNDESRKKLGGSYVKTPMGVTHYELKGEGEAIVLVHGYASPFCIYDKIYYGLVELGYKVLRYDLFGRGFSDRLPEKNSVDFFAKQLEEVTDALLGDESFILMGTSMGGAISATYIKNNPGRVKKLVCLAPAGMDSLKPPFYMYLSSCPVVGDILFKIMGAKILIKATQKWSCIRDCIFLKNNIGIVWYFTGYADISFRYSVSGEGGSNMPIKFHAISIRWILCPLNTSALWT